MSELEKYEGALFRVYRARLRDQAVQTQTHVPISEGELTTWSPAGSLAKQPGDQRPASGALA